MTEISLDTALKLIPIYGDERNLDLQAYIDGVSFVLTNVKPTEQNNYLKIAKIRLRGEIGAAVRRSELDTWNELKEFLRSRTDKQQSESFLEDQLISLKQKHNESIQQFSDRIDKIGHKLIIALCKSGIDSKMAELSTERRMHKSFVKGVVEPFRNILLNRKTNSFNDAVKDALSLELELEEDRVIDKRKKFENDKCFKCGKTGHRAANCRYNRDVKIINSRIITCYNCGKTGHMARECRSAKQQTQTQNKFNNHQSRDSQQYEPSRRYESSRLFENKPLGRVENKPSGNDMRLPSTSRNGGSEVTKSRDWPQNYQLMTKHT